MPDVNESCSNKPAVELRGVSFIDDVLGRREAAGPAGSPEYLAESFKSISKCGFTAIRVPFYWESYAYNKAEFLDRIELIARQAQANNLCVFYDNHHFYTSSYWNLEVEGKSVGRGFPSEAVRDFPAVQGDYIATAGPFWKAFWENDIRLDGIRIWDAQAGLFREIIARVDGYDSVAGYEILNEPHLFDISQYEKLGTYHTYMAREIRNSTGKKIFFDRENTWGFQRSPSSEPAIFPRGVSGLVYAPHLYAVPYPGTNAEKQISNFRKWSQQWGCEVLIGETAGVTRQDAEQLLSSFRQAGFGWTFWSWKKAGSAGAGKTYFQGPSTPATDALQALLAAMNSVYR